MIFGYVHASTVQTFSAYHLVEVKGTMEEERVKELHKDYVVNDILTGSEQCLLKCVHVVIVWKLSVRSLVTYYIAKNPSQLPSPSQNIASSSEAVESKLRCSAPAATRLFRIGTETGGS